MTAYALLSIKVAHADREYRRLRLEAQKLYQQADKASDNFYFLNIGNYDPEYWNELQEAAHLVDKAAGQYYDVANCMWPGRDDDEQEADAADWMQFTQELRHG